MRGGSCGAAATAGTDATKEEPGEAQAAVDAIPLAAFVRAGKVEPKAGGTGLWEAGVEVSSAALKLPRRTIRTR